MDSYYIYIMDGCGLNNNAMLWIPVKGDKGEAAV